MTAAGVSSRSPAKDKTTFEQEALHSLKVLWLPRGHKNKKKTRETFFTASSRRSTGRQYHYWPFGGQSLGAVIETVGVGSSISSGNVASSSMTIGAAAAQEECGGSQRRLRSSRSSQRRRALQKDRWSGGANSRRRLSGPSYPRLTSVRRKNTSGRRC